MTGPDPLLEEIRSAFKAVNRPRYTLADAEVRDDDDENSRFPEFDRFWWEVPDELLDRCSAPFCCLEAADLVYYLPAYMSWAIRRGPHAHRQMSFEFLIYYLGRAEGGGKIKAMLSREQHRAVAQFLIWVQTNESLAWIRRDVTHALSAIWQPEGLDAGVQP